MRLIFLFLIVVLFKVAQAQQKVDSYKHEIVIRGVNILPMDSETILKNQTVIIKDGKINSIGAKLSYSKDAFVINGEGKYLMPGLAEMHAHVPPIDDLEPMKEVLLLFAANGITTIRGMLGHAKHLVLRDKINRGEILGPHFYTTGPSFNGMSVTTPASGKAMVHNQKNAGYDYLKLHPGLSRQKFDSIAAAAKEVGIPFVGHVSFGVGIWRAIDSGYSSIDHLDGFIEGLVPNINTMVEQEAGLFGMFVADKADTTQIPKLMQALKSEGINVVPTQSLAERWFSPAYNPESFKHDPHAKYLSKETVDQWIESAKNLRANGQYNVDKINQFVKLRRKLIKACQQNDVPLLLGCDAPQVFNVPGFSTHDELGYLVLAGLTPYEALKTGTVNVAKYLGLKNSGIIKSGAEADVILLNDNPLSDINNTKKIEGVMLKGQWLSKNYINNELKKIEK